MKFPSILELQVVRIPFVHMLSLMATGTPARGPFNLPASMSAWTFPACSMVFSSFTVTKAWMDGSMAFIRAREASAA